MKLRKLHWRATWGGIVFCVLLATGTKGYAATISAVAPSFEAVNAAVSSAADGDVIVLPAGVGNWSGRTLTTSKAVSFSGAGPGLTILTNSGTSRFLVLSPASDRQIKISGIAFSHAYNGDEIPSIVLTERCSALWVDNCQFRNSARSLTAQATCYGLIRNSTFVNCDTAIFVQNVASDDNEDGDAEWRLGYRLGTTNTLVVEDCGFLVNRSGSYDEQFYGQGASRYTVRRCWFSVSGSAIAPFCDSHGDWGIGDRGSHVYEFYDNLITNNSATYSTFHFRGGLMIARRNQVFRGESDREVFRFRNESYGNLSPPAFSPKDQLQNCYWADNRLDGIWQTNWTALSDAQNYNWDSSDSKQNVVFSQNEDHWVPKFMIVPAWAPSSSYVRTSGSTAPSYVKHGGSLYRCVSSHASGAANEPGVGANWQTVWVRDAWHVYLRNPEPGDPIYPYTELEYPHPMVKAANGWQPKPLPPSNVRIEATLSSRAFGQ